MQDNQAKSQQQSQKKSKNKITYDRLLEDITSADVLSNTDDDYNSFCADLKKLTDRKLKIDILVSLGEVQKSFFNYCLEKTTNNNTSFIKAIKEITREDLKTTKIKDSSDYAIDKLDHKAITKALSQFKPETDADRNLKAEVTKNLDPDNALTELSQSVKNIDENVVNLEKQLCKSCDDNNEKTEKIQKDIKTLAKELQTDKDAKPIKVILKHLKEDTSNILNHLTSEQSDNSSNQSDSQVQDASLTQQDLEPITTLLQQLKENIKQPDEPSPAQDLEETLSQINQNVLQIHSSIKEQNAQPSSSSSSSITQQDLEPINAKIKTTMQSLEAIQTNQTKLDTKIDALSELMQNYITSEKKYQDKADKILGEQNDS